MYILCKIVVNSINNTVMEAGTRDMIGMNTKNCRGYRDETSMEGMLEKEWIGE
jgi:hypothetical protein